MAANTRVKKPSQNPRGKERQISPGLVSGVGPELCFPVAFRTLLLIAYDYPHSTKRNADSWGSSRTSFFLFFPPRATTSIPLPGRRKSVGLHCGRMGGQVTLNPIPHIRGRRLAWWVPDLKFFSFGGGNDWLGPSRRTTLCGNGRHPRRPPGCALAVAGVQTSHLMPLGACGISPSANDARILFQQRSVHPALRAFWESSGCGSVFY